MKIQHPQRLLIQSLLFGLLILGVQCTTLHYAGIQSDFEKAVLADNSSADSPFIDRYQTVEATLTDTYIMRLDPKLKANAWMLRALSQWRSGDFDGARRSAEKGLNADPPEGSRDLIVLSMIDGMTITTERERAARVIEKQGLQPSAYADHYESELAEAWASLSSVERKFGPQTPTAVKDYWSYECWRCIQAWDYVISTIQSDEADGGRVARNTARKRAEKHLGTDFDQASANAVAKVSAESPFRSKMR